MQKGSGGGGEWEEWGSGGRASRKGGAKKSEERVGVAKESEQVDQRMGVATLLRCTVQTASPLTLQNSAEAIKCQGQDRPTSSPDVRKGIGEITARSWASPGVGRRREDAPG